MSVDGWKKLQTISRKTLPREAPSEAVWDMLPLAMMRVTNKDAWARAVAAAQGYEIGGDAVRRGVDDALSIAAQSPGMSFVSAFSYESSQVGELALRQLVRELETLGDGDLDSSDLLRYYTCDARPVSEWYSDMAAPPSVIELVRGLLEADGADGGVLYCPCVGAADLLSAACDAVHPTKVLAQGVDEQDVVAALMMGAIMGVDVQTADMVATDRDGFVGETADRAVFMAPINASVWHNAGSETDASRWPFGTPPADSANYAWIQQAVTHLKPGGKAYVVIGSRALTTNMYVERSIRDALVVAGVVEAVIDLPGLMLGSNPATISVLVLKAPHGDRDDEVAHTGATDEGDHDNTLFVDLRDLGTKASDGIHRELDETVVRFAIDAYASFRSGASVQEQPQGARNSSGEENAGAKAVRARVVGAQDVLQAGCDLRPETYLKLEQAGLDDENRVRPGEDIDDLMVRLAQSQYEINSACGELANLLGQREG